MKRRISNERCVELESPVDAQFYEDMASQCGPALTKTRSKITVGSHVWEIDVFDTPELWGTEIAEIELSSEGEEFAIQDRKSVGQGKSVSVRVDLGGGRVIKKKQEKLTTNS